MIRMILFCSYHAHCSFKVNSLPLNIDMQWLQSLVDLSMAVPEYWWDGCKGNIIYMGKIAAIDDGAEGGKNFIFELDRTKEDNRSLPPEQYSM